MLRSVEECGWVLRNMTYIILSSVAISQGRDEVFTR